MFDEILISRVQRFNLGGDFHGLTLFICSPRNFSITCNLNFNSHGCILVNQAITIMNISPILVLVIGRDHELISCLDLSN